MLSRADAPEAGQVSGYRRIFSPAPKRVNVGEFNPLDPTNPFQGSEKIAEHYDIAVKNNVHTPAASNIAFFPGASSATRGCAAKPSSGWNRASRRCSPPPGRARTGDCGREEAVVV